MKQNNGRKQVAQPASDRSVRDRLGINKIIQPHTMRGRKYSRDRCLKSTVKGG